MPPLLRGFEREYNAIVKREARREKFSFEEMKAAAMSANPEIRKRTFKEYFERFEEFPSYLFDNTERIDSVLYQTIQDLVKDPETTKGMHKGIEILLERLPAPNT